MADRVAVFNHGRIMQIGVPEEIYRAAEHPLRRRFRRFLQRADARTISSSSTPGSGAGRAWRPAKRSKSARAGKALPASCARASSSARPTGLPSRPRAHASTSSFRPRNRRPPKARRRALLGAGRPAPDGRAGMSMDAALPASASTAILPGRGGVSGALSDLFWRRPKFLLFLMLTPPVLWLGIIYLGSLFALLLQSFFSIDEYSGLITREFTLKTYGDLLQPANFDIIVRTVTMAAIVTLAAAVVAFPIAYFAARYAQRQMEGAVLSRRHAAAVVELPGQDLRLEADPRQGRHPHLAVRQAASVMAARCLAVAAGGRRQFAVGLLHRHLHRLRLCLAAVHGAAGAGGTRARAGQSRRSVVRSRRIARPDLSATCCSRWRCPASSPARSSPSR